MSTMTDTTKVSPFTVAADRVNVFPAMASAYRQPTIKTIMPAPQNWLVFHYGESDGKVSPWQWQPVMFVAHVIDDDGVDAIAPMIDGEWGHVLPANNMTICMVHVAAAAEWLDRDTDLVNAEGLAEYLEKVQP
jgi:hypothetical protein